MSLLKLFTGPPPEKLEEKGDALFAAGHWGQAKLAYEGSLDKRQKRSGPDQDAQRRLMEKIRAAEFIGRRGLLTGRMTCCHPCRRNWPNPSPRCC